MSAGFALPFLTDVWFEGLGKPQVKDPETEQTSLDPQLTLRCAACRAEITTRSAQITVAGQFEHHFFNPAGLVFLIGCFAAAPGCHVVGPASTEFLGFPPTLGASPVALDAKPIWAGSTAKEPLGSSV